MSYKKAAQKLVNTADGHELFFSPLIPWEESFGAPWITFGTYSDLEGNEGLHPIEYAGYKVDQLSWHNGCYLHMQLNPSTTSRFGGPDAIKMLKKYCANSFENFPVGKGKHAIFLNKYGNLMEHGLLLRTGTEEFHAFWLDPYLAYCIDTCGMDVWREDLTEKTYLYQLGGPKSLEIVEAATGEDLHDIPFMGHKMSTIAGKQVRIVRMGMAGSLAYEVHGLVEEAIPVYNQLRKAGEKYGMILLGQAAYNQAHWENGFTQSGMDFVYAWAQDPDFIRHLVGGAEDGETVRMDFDQVQSAVVKGTYGSDVTRYYKDPIACGWGKTVNYDHDFIGKEALKKIRDSRHRIPVTLEWNADDVCDVYRNLFTDEEKYKDISKPDDLTGDATAPCVAYQVLNKKGEDIGMATGRMVSVYYNKMISVATIYEDEAVEGNEVIVLWGDADTRVKEIRATVARWPYMNEGRNQKVDVNKIPRGTM